MLEKRGVSIDAVLNFRLDDQVLVGGRAQEGRRVLEIDFAVRRHWNWLGLLTKLIGHKTD